MCVVKVYCPLCGVVSVAATTMSLLVRADRSGHLTFRCPRCTDTVTQECDADTVVLLRSVWVPETVLPARDGQPALTEDELIDFGRQIEGGDDPWKELLTTV